VEIRIRTKIQPKNRLITLVYRSTSNRHRLGTNRNEPFTGLDRQRRCPGPSPSSSLSAIGGASCRIALVIVLRDGRRVLPDPRLFLSAPSTIAIAVAPAQFSSPVRRAPSSSEPETTNMPARPSRHQTKTSATPGLACQNKRHAYGLAYRPWLGQRRAQEPSPTSSDWRHPPHLSPAPAASPDISTAHGSAFFHQTLPHFTHHTTTLRYPTTLPTTGVVFWGLITRQRLFFLFFVLQLLPNQANLIPPLVGAVSSTLLPSPNNETWGQINHCVERTLFLYGGQLVAPRSRSRRLFGKISRAPF